MSIFLCSITILLLLHSICYNFNHYLKDLLKTHFHLLILNLQLYTNYLANSRKST